MAAQSPLEGALRAVVVDAQQESLRHWLHTSNEQDAMKATAFLVRFAQYAQGAHAAHPSASPAAAATASPLQRSLRMQSESTSASTMARHLQMLRTQRQFGRFAAAPARASPMSPPAARSASAATAHARPAAQVGGGRGDTVYGNCYRAWADTPRGFDLLAASASASASPGAAAQQRSASPPMSPPAAGRASLPSMTLGSTARMSYSMRDDDPDITAFAHEYVAPVLHDALRAYIASVGPLERLDLVNTARLVMHPERRKMVGVRRTPAMWSASASGHVTNKRSATPEPRAGASAMAVTLPMQSSYQLQFARSQDDKFRPPEPFRTTDSPQPFAATSADTARHHHAATAYSGVHGLRTTKRADFEVQRDEDLRATSKLRGLVLQARPIGPVTSPTSRGADRALAQPGGGSPEHGTTYTGTLLSTAELARSSPVARLQRRL